MIKEVSVKPKPQNNNAKIVFLACTFITAVLILVYFLMDKYKGVVGFCAICFLTSAILIYTKYMAPIFFYDITFDTENTPIFVVRRQTGKRIETLARVDLADITDLKLETREERKKHKTPAGVLKYNYCPTMNPPSSCRLFLNGRYEKAEILIEISKEYSELLLSFSKEAREMNINNEDY